MRTIPNTLRQAWCAQAQPTSPAIAPRPLVLPSSRSSPTILGLKPAPSPLAARLTPVAIPRASPQGKRRAYPYLSEEQRAPQAPAGHTRNASQREVEVLGRRQHDGSEGRPCRALFLIPLAYPGFGRPCRAAHPGLCRGRPYRGLAPRLSSSEVRGDAKQRGQLNWSILLLATSQGAPHPFLLQTIGHPRASLGQHNFLAATVLRRARK